MHAAEAGFVSLADIVRPPSGMAERGAVRAVIVAEEPADAEPPALRDAAVTSPISDQAAAIRAARLFCAELRDALEAAVADLLREIAADVLARELRLAPVDLTAIASRLLAERLAEEPLQLRVAPAEAGIVCDLPVVADPALEPGDAILECRSGTIDARLGVRLAAILSAVAP